jgi:hypothetical protein
MDFIGMRMEFACRTMVATLVARTVTISVGTFNGASPIRRTAHLRGGSPAARSALGCHYLKASLIGSPVTDFTAADGEKFAAFHASQSDAMAHHVACRNQQTVAIGRRADVPGASLKPRD